MYRKVEGLDRVVLRSWPFESRSPMIDSWACGMWHVCENPMVVVVIVILYPDRGMMKKKRN